MDTNIKISNYARYVVFSYSDAGETVYEYIGDDLFDAQDTFDKLKNYLIHEWVEDYNATIVYKNNLNDEIIDKFDLDEYING